MFSHERAASAVCQILQGNGDPNGRMGNLMGIFRMPETLSCLGSRVALKRACRHGLRGSGVLDHGSHGNGSFQRVGKRTGSLFVAAEGRFPSRAFASPKLRGTPASPQAHTVFVRLPGCVSPTLSPTSNCGSPVSPVSPGKKIRRNAAALGIPLDLRGQTIAVGVPVRTIAGDIMAPSPVAITGHGLNFGSPGPMQTLKKVVRGGA
ncbi:unnamed protein product [Effrenium voratum]|nr:unnamed protein product [Effrenium voratum]